MTNDDLIEANMEAKNTASQALFSYGTLQFEQVQLDNFGRLLTGKKDSLPKYQVGEVEIKDPQVIKSSGTDIHPILIYTGNEQDKVEGTVFYISEYELQQADTYEVEEYQRIEAKLTSGISAWIYADAKQLKSS